jgi:hypothetical protein
VLCLALLPWIRSVRGNEPDGGAPRRARISSFALGAACLAWLPYRLAHDTIGPVMPLLETLFTAVFVASGLFLLAGAAVLTQAPRTLLRLGTWLALALLLMYARRWAGALDGTAAAVAQGLLLAVPAAAGALLLALGAQAWRELRPAAAAAPLAPQSSASIR